VRRTHTLPSRLDELEATLPVRLENSMDLEDMQRMRDEVRAAACRELDEVVIPEVMAMEREKAKVLAEAVTQRENEKALERELVKGEGSAARSGVGKRARKGKQ
jgi:hypothetical protein